MESISPEAIVKALYYLIDCVKFVDRVSKLPCCNTCGKLKDCEYRPEWGDSVRWNCPLWKGGDGE